MTITIHATSQANVEYSLNAWFAAQLALIAFPTSVFGTPAYNIAYEFPEVPLVPPCFSFNHIPVMGEQRFQGNVASAGQSVTCRYALLEINAWVSRDQKQNYVDIWRPRLQFMADAIAAIHTAFPTVQIQDIQSDPSNPLPVQYKINLGDIKSPETLADLPNPAFRRRRMLLSYNWMARVNT